MSEKTNKPIESTQLEKALKAFRDGHMTAYKACKLYSVNSGTVSAHLRGITKSERKDRPPKFSTRKSSIRFNLSVGILVFCSQ